MGLAYIIPVNAAEGLYNIVTIGPGSAPPRPHPGPTPPGGPVDPGWGIDVPVDPGYGIPETGLPHPSHPIYYPPGSLPHPEHPIVIPPPPDLDLHPEHPIVIPKPSLPPGSAVVVPIPPGATAPPPPAGTPEGSTPYVIWFGPGTVAGVIYLPPVATPKKKAK